MNKLKKLFLTLPFFFTIISHTYAQENIDSSKKISAVFNWGLSFEQITRIQKQEERSNFVWRDDLAGAFFSVQTKNAPINFIAKIGAYYPFHSTFNYVPQNSKQVLVYAFDLNIGPIWSFPLWNIVTLDLSPVINLRYQMYDFFHHIDLGCGIIAGLEFPISSLFTILLNGEFTYDYGNLGSNANIRIYDAVFSYGAQLGFRISKRSRNTFSYIK